MRQAFQPDLTNVSLERLTYEMTMEINWNPSIRQLRVFGLTSLAALPLATALWSRGSLTAIGYAAAVGGVLAVIALLRPRGLRPLFVAINVATWPLVMIVHDLILLVAFYGVMVPVGLIFRLIGRDALQLTIDRRATSYWQARSGPPMCEITSAAGKECVTCLKTNLKKPARKSPWELSANSCSSWARTRNGGSCRSS